MTKFNIGNIQIGESAPCFIIAEAGINHNGSLEHAKKLIDVASNAGVNAVKFQILTAKGLYIEDAGVSKSGVDAYDIWKNVEVPESWIQELKEYCSQKGVLFFSSVFDEKTVDLLDPFVDLYKIASSETTHIPLLKKVAKTGKPIIFSIGGAKVEEVEEAVKTIKKEGNSKIAILHCVQHYPTPLDKANVLVIKSLQERYPNAVVGYSDHSLEPSTIPVASVTLGAKIIEKHFTLSRHLPGIDQHMSLEPHELAALVTDIRKTEKKLEQGESIPINHTLLGNGRIELTKDQEETLQFVRRKIFASQEIKIGEEFTTQNLIVVRPGNRNNTGGIHPREFQAILGKKAIKDIRKLDLITSNHFSNEFQNNNNNNNNNNDDDDDNLIFQNSNPTTFQSEPESETSLAQEIKEQEEQKFTEEIPQSIEANNEIIEGVTTIFQETFPEISNLNLQQKQDQFENWDSFSHLELVSKIEEKFCISFTVDEIVELDSPKKFIDTISSKK